MKKFIKQFLSLLLMVVVPILLLFWSSNHICNKLIDFSIPSHKNTLILGSSYVAYAIDDQIVDQAYNMAKKRESYFYTYLKAQKLLAANQQIDTVVISYHLADLLPKHNLTDAFYLDKHAHYFFMMDTEAFGYLLSEAPINTLNTIPTVIWQNIKALLKKNRPINERGFGKYRKLEKWHLKNAIEFQQKKRPYKKQQFSPDLQKYLLKTYQLCQQQNIVLKLLMTPTHKEGLDEFKLYEKDFKTYASTHMPKAQVINHTQFPISDEGFADLTHLTTKGSIQYSNYLKLTGFIDNYHSNE